MTDAPAAVWLCFAAGCLAVGFFFGHVVRAERDWQRDLGRDEPAPTMPAVSRPGRTGGPTTVPYVRGLRHADDTYRPAPYRGRVPAPRPGDSEPAVRAEPAVCAEPAMAGLPSR